MGNDINIIVKLRGKTFAFPERAKTPGAEDETTTGWTDGITVFIITDDDILEHIPGYTDFQDNYFPMSTWGWCILATNHKGKFYGAIKTAIVTQCLHNPSRKRSLYPPNADP